MAARKTAHVTEVTAPRSTRIITCANHKGGTGKTTTAVNVSAGLAVLKQQRVLLVDCDPRGHASLALGVDMAHVRYSVTDLLTGAIPEVQALCWEKGDNLHILPANATLTDVEPELLRRVDGRLQLKQALQPLLETFDVIVIDTPPTLGLWTQAPLVASTDLLIPVDVGSFAFEGMRQLLGAIARLRQEVPLTLATPHILLTKFDARTTLSASRQSHPAGALWRRNPPHRDSCECRSCPGTDGTPEYFCVRSHLTRSPGLSARGGGVTREQQRRGVHRHRHPVPAPEEGTRGPQSAQERASCSRRLTG